MSSQPARHWSNDVETGDFHHFRCVGRRGFGLERALRRHSRPAAADAPTLDELLAKISAMALDLLPDNHPGIDPASLFLQITALREAESAAA
jgi:hypothetical protein